MPTPQPGIMPGGNTHACFLVLDLAGAPPRKVSDALRRAQPLAREMDAVDPRDRLVMNVGIGSEMWDRLSPGRRPKGLRPFKRLSASGRSAPATGGDLLAHIASARHDLNFELASRLLRSFGAEAKILEEVHGFRYLDT